MKINAIEKSKQEQRSKNLPAKKDLTSFGVSKIQEEPTQVNTQKAEEAIKTTFLSNVSFKGHTEKIYAYCCGTSGQLSHSINSSRSFHPNSSIERYPWRSYSKDCSYTVDVYFADPEEVVSSEIKTSHEYVVSDNEPRFPSINKLKEKYFSNNSPYKEDFHKDCKIIFEYHDRLKAADLRRLVELEQEKENLEKELRVASTYKEGLADNYVENPWGHGSGEKAKASYFHGINTDRLTKLNNDIQYYKNRLARTKEQQELAVTLYNILNESGGLFILRDQLLEERYDVFRIPGESYYGRSMYKIEDVPEQLAKYQTRVNDLEQTIQTTQSWLNLRKKEAAGYRTYSEKEKDRDDIAELEYRIGVLTKNLNEAKRILKYIESIPEKYAQINNRLKAILHKLANNYPKVDAFYRTNARKILCRL